MGFAVVRAMKLRRTSLVAFFGVCLALTTWSSLSLLAAPEETWICCGSPEDCPNNGRCCAPGPLNEMPCAEELAGYCMTVCKPINQ